MNVRFALHFSIVLCLFSVLHTAAFAQIEVGNTTEFGGITVSLNEQGRQRLQQEVNRIYADRATLYAQLEALRQLDPFIRAAMQNVSLPVDFRYLALPFTPRSGYWNIPAPMLNQSGMQTTSVVDERYHPLLATETAVAQLARLQEQMANPLQVAIRYIQAADPTQPERLIGSGSFILLDSQSPASVWKLLARRLVFNREDPTFRPNRTFVLWTHTNSNGRTRSDLAFQYNLPTERLRPFDSWLTGPAVPAEGSYPVLVRMTLEEYATAIRRRNNNTKVPDPSENDPDLGFPVLRRMEPVRSALNTPVFLYEINSLPGIQAQPGDNVITLAFYGGISVKSFLEYNDMSDRDVVRPGEVYYLAPKARRAKVPFHVVSRGQTLRDVANQYGVRLKFLLRYNDIEPNQRVLEGRVLWMQEKRPSNQAIEYRQLPPIPKPPVLEPDTTQMVVVPPIDSTDVTLKPSPSIDTLLTSIPADSQNNADVDSVRSTTSSVPATPTKLHTVKLGQTYYSISRLHGIPLAQLYRLNNLSERIPLRVGQQLIISMTPGAEPVPASGKPLPAWARTPTPPRKPAPSRNRSQDQGMKTVLKIESIPADEAARRPVKYHVVKPGQTVYRVALINGVTVQQVMRWNNLKNYTIEVGQRLVIRK